MTQAIPLWEYVMLRHDGSVPSAASALGVNRSTLRRCINSGFVINGKLYTSKRK